eukprot:c4340_g1_i1 orf=574-1356(+)
MLGNEKLRRSRRLRVAPHARVDRASSSRRELLVKGPGETEAAELVGSFSLIPSWKLHSRRAGSRVFTMFKSILDFIPLPPMPCMPWLAFPSSRFEHALLGGNMVTGTLFGYRKGHVYFAVQEDPRLQPAMLLELATPTNSLVKEMASGLVRIALECERTQNRDKLFLEPVWTMYCNGRKTGYAFRRSCTETELQVLTLCQAISMGAGVLPSEEEDGPDGELMYMRAKFERVVGSKDSEAFYMMNPDGNGGPELSIFLLRI